jgi:hypothetical protein
MGEIQREIDEDLADWVHGQHVFFIGSAPLSPDGHVNVSPKGGRGSFRVLGPHRFAYLDIAGSGAETIAHLKENGRVVVMFCAFEDRPRIVRFHGRGVVHQVGNPSFDELLPHFRGADLNLDAARSIVDIEVQRIASSCGYSVPLMEFEGMRPHQDLWVHKRLDRFGPDGVLTYVREKNSTSLDGLPAVDTSLPRS